MNQTRPSRDPTKTQAYPQPTADGEHQILKEAWELQRSTENKIEGKKNKDKAIYGGKNSENDDVIAKEEETKSNLQDASARQSIK